MTVHQARTLSVSIERDWREVYDFTSIPENFARWAAGLGRRLEKSGEDWIAEDPNGRPLRIRFSPPNGYGVVDHDVSGEMGEVHMAMRVVPNGSGAEVMMTVLRQPDMTDAAFAADAAAIERDLETLKALLER